MKIEGKIFFITGGASGFGLATTELIVKKGGYVAILDVNEEKGENAVKQFGTEKTFFAKVDVREDDQILAAIETSDKKWPKRPIGGVINCGGIAVVHQTIAKDGTPFPIDLFRQIVDINLTGSFNASRLVVSRMLKDPIPEGETDRGIVVLVSSTSYQEGQQGQVCYAASKGGVASMVLPMARDLGSHSIRVNGIAPSMFATPMGNQMPERLIKALLADVVHPKRFGDAMEFAELCIHLIENGYLNGEVFRISGGSRMSRLGKL